MPTTVEEDIGGGNNDYSTIAAWNTATQIDLTLATGSDEIRIGNIYDGTYNEWASLQGATTDATHYRMLRVADGEGHDPLVAGNNGVYIHNDLNVLRPREDYFKLVGPMLVECTHTGSSNRRVIQVTNNATDGTIHGLYVRMTGGTGTNRGININQSSTNNWHVQNCIVVGSGGSDGLDVGIYSTASSLVEVYHNCVYNVDSGSGVGNGIELATLGVGLVFNNIVIGSGSSDFVGTYASSNGNASSDTSAPGSTVQYHNETASSIWQDAPNNDFRPALGGNALNNGINLVALALDPYGQYTDFTGPPSYPDSIHNGDGEGVELGAYNWNTLVELTAQSDSEMSATVTADYERLIELVATIEAHISASAVLQYEGGDPPDPPDPGGGFRNKALGLFAGGEGLGLVGTEAKAAAGVAGGVGAGLSLGDTKAVGAVVSGEGQGFATS